MLKLLLVYILTAYLALGLLQPGQVLRVVLGMA